MYLADARVDRNAGAPFVGVNLYAAKGCGMIRAEEIT
jgi:hypothetical protein